MVKINGVENEVAGMTLMDYLRGAGYSLDRIAVECNGQLIRKADYAGKVLEDGDCLEVVSFVGGG